MKIVSSWQLNIMIRHNRGDYNITVRETRRRSFTRETPHLHSKWSIYMDHLRPSLCYNRVIIFALGSWNLQLNSTFLK